mmetsp:Transcript_36799/g.88517  ORF Transcript_36799/g.88517 Transcript_36799/m.88517 type:complete len:218 (-) Transcript_36799:160-813(-)
MAKVHAQFRANADLQSAAHLPSDFALMGKFCSLARFLDRQVDRDGIKQMLKAVKMLRLCDYTAEDIRSILSHAAVYVSRTLSVCGDTMDATEASNVLVVLMFVSHSYTMDEHCPLRVWHQHLFAEYCTVKELNAALVRLLNFQGSVLRVEEAEHKRISLALKPELTPTQIPATSAGVRGPVPRLSMVCPPQTARRAVGYGVRPAYVAQPWTVRARVK